MKDQVWFEALVVALSFGIPSALIASAPKVKQCASLPSLVVLFGGVAGSIHFIFEATGVNAWYCSSGNACKRQTQSRAAFKDLAGAAMWFGVFVMVWCGSSDLSKLRHELAVLFALAGTIDLGRVFYGGDDWRVLAASAIFSVLVITEVLLLKCAPLCNK